MNHFEAQQLKSLFETGKIPEENLSEEEKKALKEIYLKEISDYQKEYFFLKHKTDCF